MSRAERRLLDIANLLVGGTGLIYAVMKYLIEAADEWAVVNHPWQPHVQHLHILAAPLLVFVAGAFWKHHVLEGRRGNGSNGRATGLALAIQLVPMVLSGYLIQVSVAENWRLVWIWVHVITGGLWCLLVVSHRFHASTGGDEAADSSR